MRRPRRRWRAPRAPPARSPARCCARPALTGSRCAGAAGTARGQLLRAPVGGLPRRADQRGAGRAVGSRCGWAWSPTTRSSRCARWRRRGGCATAPAAWWPRRPAAGRRWRRCCVPAPGGGRRQAAARARVRTAGTIWRGQPRGHRGGGLARRLRGAVAGLPRAGGRRKNPSRPFRGGADGSPVRARRRRRSLASGARRRRRRHRAGRRRSSQSLRRADPLAGCRRTTATSPGAPRERAWCWCRARRFFTSSAAVAACVSSRTTARCWPWPSRPCDTLPAGAARCRSRP